MVVSVIPLMVVASLAVVLAAGAVLLALQNARLRAMLDEARNAWSALRDTPARLEMSMREAAAVRQRLEAAHRDADTSREELTATRGSLSSAEAEMQRMKDWLDHQDKELAWYRLELGRRPRIVRRTYKILTLGVSGTGKTALTLKWANPLVDLGSLQGTKVERYERTVSHKQDGDELIEHVFEVRDWGGEHIVDAQQELIVDEIHGLLLVVDLTARDGAAVDPARIQQQLSEFRLESLKFFFGPKTLAMCQSVVLFINKSDVLSGTPADIEREARRHYQRLIDDLGRYSSQLDVHVLVGSATYGHSTHHLFAHFVSRILPESAYDRQLLQRMKADTPEPGAEVRAPALRSPVPARVAAPRANGAAPLPAPSPLPAAAAPPRLPPLPAASPANSTSLETVPHVARRPAP